MPTSSSSEDRSRLDPVLLRRLHDRLIELRGKDTSASADTVLQELHPSLREIYRSPLLEMLGEPGEPEDSSNGPAEAYATAVTAGDDHDSENGDQWTVDLPTGFVAEPIDLPPAKRPPADDSDESGPSEKLPEYVGKFRVKGELGRGANGVVYLGYDEQLQRNVAIKLSLVSGRKLQERLRVEASKAAQIDADGIVPVYHIGTTDEGAVYIVQKFIEGTTLRSVLKNGGPLSPARGVALIREIAAALEPAHYRDILHRDLKPDNILIDHSGKAWIADFGLAISEEEQQGRRCELAGTPAYMSPEQIKGRIDFLDPRSDIWGLGVMFYEVLTGKLPFSGKDRKSLMDQICERDPRPMQQRAPQLLTPEMNAVFERCCAKKPSDRFASTTELIAALDELLAAGLSEHNINGRYVSVESAESLFHYDTATVRDPTTVRGTIATVRTERQTGRMTLHGTQESESFGSARSSTANPTTWWLLLGAVGLLLLLLTVFGFLALRPGNTPVVTPGPGPGRGGSEPPPPQIKADGSAAFPWIVASDGTGSHATIQAAIDEPGDASVILVKALDNAETLDIRRRVTIIGEAPERACTIRSNDETTVEINCADLTQLVTLRNLTIRGLGGSDTAPFNTIDLHDSALAITDCEIESRLQNCIKARGGSLELSDTTLQSISGSHAVSCSDHDRAVIKKCNFFAGGVELTRGSGTVSDCRFKQGVGISAHVAERPVYVNDCDFEECYIGVAVNNQVTVILGSDCSFERCDWGLMLHALDDTEPGRLEAKSARFEACKYDACYLAGGTLEIEPGCTITNCATGVFVETGTATLTGVEISGGSVGATMGEKRKDDLGQLIIRSGDASLTIGGGTVQNAAFGLNLTHPRGDCVVNRTQFLNNSEAAINYAAGELAVTNAQFRGGKKGIFAWPSSPKDGRREVVIESSTFSGQSGGHVETAGEIDLYLHNCQLSSSSPTARISSPPSKIWNGKP